MTCAIFNVKYIVYIVGVPTYLVYFTYYRCYKLGVKHYWFVVLYIYIIILHYWLPTRLLNVYIMLLKMFG